MMKNNKIINEKNHNYKNNNINNNTIDENYHSYYEDNSIIFERSRIDFLNDERIRIQQKSFTNWVNTFLEKAKLNVDDIFVDLADGIKLLKLLEIISGQKLGKPNKGRLRLQKIENVNKSLAFLHTKVKLESIGAEDIVDGNKKLILGLIWTIILRFQIQDIEIQLDDESDKKHSAKEALLLWCQRKTNNYPNVNIKDFTQSWRDGMAFNALIHSHRPELIDYDKLDPKNSIENLNNAFKVAKDHLAIKPLFDPEDVDTIKPDEKSILTYVSSYYHTFAKYNSELISGKRITNIISQLMEIDRLQINYEILTTNLINWIQIKIDQLEKQEFFDNYEQIQHEMIKFNNYITAEKPQKYIERSKIEELLFNIQTKRKALGQSLYTPNDGKLIQDINKIWNDLEKAEHFHKLKLDEQLKRIKKTNDLAENFYRKSNIHKVYLEEMIDVLSDYRYGQNNIEATMKKHEAIYADILCRKKRIDLLELTFNELKKLNYIHIDNVENKINEIKILWEKLLSLLEMHQNNLTISLNFMRTKSEIETITNEFNDLIRRMNIDSNLTHLRMVEEYLHKHSLLEAQITMNNETVKRLTNNANKLLVQENVQKSSLLEKEIPNLKNSLNTLKLTYKTLIDQSEIKQKKLIKFRDFYRLLQDIEEEERTLTEKLAICHAILPGKDLLGIISLQQKHSVFEAEIKTYENRLKKIDKKAKIFIDNNNDLIDENKSIENRLELLDEIWKQLQETSSLKSKELSIIIEAFQYHADANETESWLKEKTQIAKSDDYGKDEQSAKSLLQRHNYLESEVISYSHEIDRLNSQSEKMIDSDVESLFILNTKSNLYDIPINRTLMEKTIIDNDDVDNEEFYEKIPQVCVLYDFKDKNCHVKKGDIILLISKSTKEWWKVCFDGTSKEFYVPSNYVKEIDPKIIKKSSAIQQPRKFSSANIKRQQSNKRRLSIVYNADTVEQRKLLTNTNYKKLIELCQNRRKLLEDSVKMFNFNNECNTFENWLIEMENILQKSIHSIKEQKNSTKLQQQQQQQQQDTSNDLNKKYEKMITDILANRTRLDEINRMANDVNSSKYIHAIKKRKEQIQKKWDQVNFLHKQLGKNIEGLTSVEDFDAKCTETLERINDKLSKVNGENFDIGNDLKTAQALQRKHENLEFELILITDSLKTLNMIAENVKSSYPLEKSKIDKRLIELKQLWEQLKQCSDQKRNWLDRMIGLQIVKNSTNDINAWLISYVKPLLKYDVLDSSYKNIDNLVTIEKEHDDLLVDIKGKENNINDVKQLTEKLKNQIVNPNELNIVDDMIENYKIILNEWNEKNQFITQCKQLYSFNREADKIDTMINSDLTFLEFDETGTSCQDIYALIKRHDRFLDKVNAQDQLVHNFIDNGDKLIQNNHFDNNIINEKQNKIIEKRKLLKDKAFLRQKVLQDSRIYHEIRSDAEEFSNWCQNKQKQINDLNINIDYDKNNNNNDNNNDDENNKLIEKKLKKHQKIVAEVCAHHTQLEKILNDLNELNHNIHFIPIEELNKIEIKCKNEWNDLNEIIKNDEILISSLCNKMERKKSSKAMKNRLNEIESEINLNEIPNDKMTCKILMQKNKLNEKELDIMKNKLQNKLRKKRSLDNNNENNDNDDDKNNHDYDEVKSIIDNLDKLMNKRNKQLSMLNDYYQFQFDVNAENRWINEKISIVSSNDLPQNLTEAQNFLKKIEKNLKNEILIHENIIQKIINNGNELIKINNDKNNNIENEKINSICDELDKNFKNLLLLTEKRIEKLKIYVKIHRFLFECNEIELWLNEKQNILNNPIYGNDEITLIKLLQKQKSIDLEIDTYSGLIDELSRQSDNLCKLIKNEAENEKLIKTRTNDLNLQLKKIQQLSNERNIKLMNLKQFYEYCQESNDFLDWLLKQQQILSNEDYGKDYEHCIILQSKYFDQKRLIFANETRYKQCINNNERFNKNKDINNHIDDDDENYKNFIKNNQTIITTWNNIINLLQTKEQNFIAAVKLHRFNRDVADAYERINEKYSILNNKNYGRDCQSTQNLIRNHDLFENDLVALEAQLQILINDSVKLKSAYPGGNAKQITEKLNSTLDYWEKLKKLSTFYREKLCDTYEYYRFNTIVKNLEQWSLNLINEMNIDNEQINNEFIKNNYILDVDRIQNEKNIHERIKSEIDGCENEFNILVKDANELIKNPFYNQIKESTKKLLLIRDELFNTWQIKDVLLDQLLDYCIFSRDTNQLEQFYQQFKNRIEKTEQGNTVEEVEKNLKKFDEFIKLFESHEQKYNGLNECAIKLIEKNNKHSDKIQIILDNLIFKKTNLYKLILNKREQISDDLIYQQFIRDVIETDLWIDEKKIQIEQISIIDKNNNDDIEIKLKKLQKHQTIEAEINVNNSQIIKIESNAKHLIEKKYPNSIEIRSKLDDILKKWEDLKLLSRNVCKGFEEAKDIYEFNKNIDLIESWIREKELMIQFNDTGVDYEHCLSLLKKLDDVGTDLKIDENEINNINQLADKLLNKCKNENEIDRKRLSLNENWKQLQQKIIDYRKRLNDALKIHSLNRDLDEINERIMEKNLLLSKECDAKNLSSIENEQRKHISLCNDINIIENQFKNIDDNNYKEIIGKNSQSIEKSREKIENIQNNIRKLYQECSKKDEKLDLMIKLHKFFDSMKEYENWANNILSNKLSNKIITSENVLQAENDIQDNLYLLKELETKNQNNQTLIKYGENVLLKELKQNEIENETCIEKLNEYIHNNDNLRKLLEQSWNDKNNFLKQCKQLHKFNDLYKQCDSWMKTKEAFLQNEDLGTNLNSVEDLLKKHDSFEQSLNVQQKINDLFKFSVELIEQKHFDLDNIKIKNDEILDRRNKLFELSKIRNQKLEDSKIYYNFIRICNEINRWLLEKIKVANDESYNESINLLSKKQKHAAFEAEINSNKKRIDELINNGENLIKNLHFRSNEIKNEIDNIKKLYRQLFECSEFKRKRLDDAYQSLQFFRLCDTLLLWIKNTEKTLNDQDNGKDLSSVRNLLKKQQLLENDVHNHNENIENIKDQLAHFQQNNHFQIDEIEEKGNNVIKCFNNLEKPMIRKRKILEEYFQFYQFNNDVEDEFLWIKEKENQLNQFDNANTVLDIQRLIKRHKMLETEIQTREIQLSSLVSKGHNLLKDENVNHEQIKQLNIDLQEKIQYIKDAFILKKIHLNDSLEAHQFYSDIIEAESWINEKLSFLSNDDNGRDEESVLILLKKVEAINKESERFNSTSMAKLIQQSNQLIDKNHCETDEIKEKINGLKDKFDQLSENTIKKRKILLDRSLYFKFEREANDFLSWVKEQQIIANSEDFGQDVEQVESLIQQFNTFISFILSNEERIKLLEKQAEDVVNSEEKLNEIRNSWIQLKEMTARRQELLQSAEEIHRFYQSADETVHWIKEKESSTIFDQVDTKYDDIDTIKLKIHQIEGFERDLIAVQEQVETLFMEADKLIDSFENVKEQIEERKNEVKKCWSVLNEKTKSHKENLIQIENIQSYFDHHQELLTWLNEMFALITVDDKLFSDVLGAEEQLSRHKEYEQEIRLKNENVQEFLSTGTKIISHGHIMSKEIEQRNDNIKNNYDNLIQTWEKRLKLYEYNVDARQFIRDLEQMEKWIESNHNYIDDNNFGDSIGEVEDLLLKHEEFEKTIELQLEKLNKIEGLTLLEKYFNELKREEEEQKEAELLRQKNEKLKEEEQKRILIRRINEESKYSENEFNKNKSFSMKKSSKKPQRYGSFSFAKKSNKSIHQLTANLPQFSCKGTLERKYLNEPGGKKSESRNWKSYYTVLCGHLLCFFKDKNSFNKNSAASAPLSILKAKCEKIEYKNKKHVFSIELTDKSKYLFITTDENRLQEWVNAIKFRASLPPSDQLINYENIMSPSSNLNSSQNNGSTNISDSLSSLSSLPDLHISNKNNNNFNKNNTNNNNIYIDNENKFNNNHDEFDDSIDGTTFKPKIQKYSSLPANMEPIKEDSIYAKNDNEKKKKNPDNNNKDTKNNEKIKKKRSSFFKLK